MVSIISLRIIQLRAAMAAGCDASGTSAVHEGRIGLAPSPGQHAAHGIAVTRSQMAHAQILGQQAVLRRDHVVIIVAGKFRVQPIRRLGGLSRADARRAE